MTESQYRRFFRAGDSAVSSTPGSVAIKLNLWFNLTSGTVSSTLHFFFQSKHLQIISYSKKYFSFRHCVRLASQPADAKSQSPGYDRCWVFHQYQQRTTFKATEGSGCHHIFKLYYWIPYIGEEDLVTTCCLSFLFLNA